MIKKSTVYKFYSIYLPLFCVVEVLASLYLLISFFSAVSIIAFVSSLVSLFMAFVDFSSIFTFADMVKCNSEDSNCAFKRKPFVFSPAFYKNYGFVIFIVYGILMLISLISEIIISLTIQINFLVVFCLVLLSAFSLLLMYITYNLRYKAFSGLLSYFDSGDYSEINNQKPNLLRLYGAFSAVVAVIMSIFLIVLTILFIGLTSSSLGIWSLLTIPLSILVLAISLIPLIAKCLLYIDISEMLEQYRTGLGKKEDDIKHTEEKAKLSYSFSGGIYSVLVWLGSILFAISCAASIFVSNSAFSDLLTGNYMTLLTSDYSGYFLILTILSMLIICGIAVALYFYLLNRNTGFELFGDRIKGKAIVKDGYARKVSFDLDKKNISSISVQGMFLNIISDGMKYSIMITSRDFKSKLINEIE